MTRLRWMTLASCCGLALAASARVSAQSTPWDLLGVVRTPNGSVLEGATVAVAGASTRTDAMGFFRLSVSRRDSLTIALRRIGYTPISTLLTEKELTGDTLLILMDPTSQQLEAMTIKARDLRSPMGFGSFEERRAAGHGVYVTRDEIEKRNNYRLSDVLRNKRGVQVVRLSTGGYGVRFSLYQGRDATRRCAPEIWVDGRRMRGLEIDEIPSNNVAGIELYHSLATTPAQFTAGQVDRPCGTVVIWTREPGGA